MALLGLLAAGCDRGDGATTGGSPPPPHPPATCTPAGLEAAQIIRPLGVPDGCSWTGGGAPLSPRAITTPEELAQHLTCTGAAPVIDLAVSDVYLITQTISPGHGGGEVRDDGTTVTLVSRFRPPCPDDPMPMPMQTTFALVLPKGATRAFAEASCTLPARC